MRLHEVAEAYIAFKRALGMRLDTEACVLRAFCRSVGEIDVANVKPDAVLTFLAVTVGPALIQAYRSLVTK